MPTSRCDLYLGTARLNGGFNPKETKILVIWTLHCFYSLSNGNFSLNIMSLGFLIFFQNILGVLFHQQPQGSMAHSLVFQATVSTSKLEILQSKTWVSRMQTKPCLCRFAKLLFWITALIITIIGFITWAAGGSLEVPIFRNWSPLPFVLLGQAHDGWVQFPLSNYVSFQETLLWAQFCVTLFVGQALLNSAQVPRPRYSVGYRDLSLRPGMPDACKKWCAKCGIAEDGVLVDLQGSATYCFCCFFWSSCFLFVLSLTVLFVYRHRNDNQKIQKCKCSKNPNHDFLIIFKYQSVSFKQLVSHFNLQGRFLLWGFNAPGGGGWTATGPNLSCAGPTVLGPSSGAQILKDLGGGGPLAVLDLQNRVKIWLALQNVLPVSFALK